LQSLGGNTGSIYPAPGHLFLPFLAFYTHELVDR